MYIYVYMLYIYIYYIYITGLWNSEMRFGQGKQKVPSVRRRQGLEKRKKKKKKRKERKQHKKAPVCVPSVRRRQGLEKKKKAPVYYVPREEMARSSNEKKKKANNRQRCTYLCIYNIYVYIYM